MHLSRPLLALSAALPLVLVPQGPTFAPEQGLELKKTFEMSMEMSLSELEVTMVLGGEEQVLTDEPPEVENSATQTLVVDDSYERVGDGQVLRLVRTFETINGETVDIEPDPESGEAVTTEATEESELEGETIAFTWDAEEEEFVPSFADEESEKDEELLEGLVALVDLIEFLPEEEVEKGDTWSVEGKLFMETTSWGGDLKLTSGEEEDEFDFEEQLVENTEGELECTFAGVEEELQIIRFAGTLTSEFENEDTDDEMEAEGVTQTTTFSSEMEVEGVITWDPEANHARSMEFTVTFEMGVDQEVGQESGRGEFQFNTSMVFEGEMKSTAQFE